jgi:hypothetical protein
LGALEVEGVVCARVADAGRPASCARASVFVQVAVSLAAEVLTAIPSRAAPHPVLPIVACSTSSGRVHVWQ